LREDSPPLNAVKAPSYEAEAGATSFAFDASDEYWENMRRRKGDLRVLCRDWWQTVAKNRPTEDIPGSRSWGEGDWARGMKVSESSEIPDPDNIEPAERGR
jgi:hypothetical protein